MRSHIFITGMLAAAVVVLVWAVRTPPLDVTTGRRLAWIDRLGRETPIAAPPRAYAYPRLSPDGRFLALDVRDEPDGLWMWDFDRQTLSPWSTSRASDIAPVWRHAGDALVFARGRGVAPGVWIRAAPRHRLTDGSSFARSPAESNGLLMPTSLLPDDRHLLVTATAADGFDILWLDLLKPGVPTTLVATSADDLNAEASPDGRWVVYESRRSGRSDVWLRRLGEGEVDLQVTSEGGTRPAWTKGGRELVYLDERSVLVARAIDLSAPVPSVGPSFPLFAADIYTELVGRTYDVTPDGDRFVVVLNR